MARSVITTDELAAEIERIRSLDSFENSPGCTVDEICDMIGLSCNSVLKILKKAKKEGRLDVGRKRMQYIDGRVGTAPCYLIRSKDGD